MLLQALSPQDHGAPLIIYCNYFYFVLFLFQVRDLFHVPLSVLNKSACILTDEAFLDVMPVAWELLRYINNDMAMCYSNFNVLC